MNIVVATDTGVLHPVLVVRTSSDRDQPVPFSSGPHVHEGTGGCHQGYYGRRSESERAVGVGIMEDPQRRRK